LQLEHVFAGVGVRAVKQDRDALVDDGAVGRPEIEVGGVARLERGGREQRDEQRREVLVKRALRRWPRPGAVAMAAMGEESRFTVNVD
jgi:hypothetical protein